MDIFFEDKAVLTSSFRDPSGFLFYDKGQIYRLINNCYKDNYDCLMKSGLYQELVNNELLISHVEIEEKSSLESLRYKIIKPEIIPFISYPYEWCFNQLKNAALTTLEIVKTALSFNMILKDASAYNIQFRKGRPILIDTLSFERYQEGKPWKAYRQFCQHFLAPLVLMSYVDIRLNQLLRVYIDGVPLDLARNLLPQKTKLNFSLLSHIHLHAATQKKYEDNVIKTRKVNRTGLLAIIDSMETLIKKLKWLPQGTEWGEYYNNTNYSDQAFNFKKLFVSECLEYIKPQSVWDLGANTGEFSRVSSDKSIPTISFDIDPAAVEKNYLKCVDQDEHNILPLLLDLTNPSPAIGWNNNERMSFGERGPVDMVFALALIHHLAISNNVPLDRIAQFFGSICHSLVIEFVPKSDSQVQKLLSTREDIFPDYCQDVFEKAFKIYFDIKVKRKVKDSERVLYLMKKNN